MFYKCCVLNCKSVRNDVKLHRLPVIKESLARWLSALRHKIPSGIEGSNLHVCHLHFEKRFLTTKLRVKSYGYPSLFTDEEIASGSSSASILDENKENTAGQDHAYCRKRHNDHTYYRSAPLQPTTLENIDNFHQNDGPSTSAQVTVTMEIQHGMSAHNFHQNDGTSTSAQINVTMERQHGMSARLPCKARQRSTRKIVYNTKNLTSECQILYKEYKKSKRQVQYFKTMERAKTFADKLENLLEKMHPFSKRFLWMQLRMITKNKKGRRFNTDEKLLGLSIFKQSPKCYKFLRRIFILPSKTTLNKMISSLKFQVGINPQIFSAIKNEVTSWENNKKYCSLIFDEMALEPSLTYNKSDDKIHGFVELTSIKPDLADHVLCFMLRGVVHKWQQPLAFYFSQGAASATEIKILLKEIVKAVLLTGLTPVALVSDQGASFQSALKGLQMDTREMQIKSGLPTDDTINLSGASVSILYDPCHLIKGIRNNFLSKDMQFNNKICKWQDIVDVYYTDCQHTSMRLLPKITDEHVIPQKVKKMKVKHCVQVFSHSMSAALSYTSAFSTYADGKPVSSTLKNTADAVEFFNTLFDSVNGACVSLKKCGGNRLKQAVTEKSEHIKFWQDAIKTLEKIRFLLNRKEKIVPSLKNFIITIKSLIRVWQFFQNLNIKIMRPRYFNSDPIDNFFGRVRAYNFRNINPDCHTFINTFKSLLITGVIQFHSENFNCEDVPSGDLINVADIIAPNIETCSDVEKAQDTTISWQTKAVQEKIDVQSGAYTAGWVIRKILKNNKCENCEKFNY